MKGSKLVKKKTLRYPQAKAEERLSFIQEIQHYENCNQPIVYIDESGFRQSDYRHYGYATKGTPCIDTYNWQQNKQTNAIGAIYQNQLFAVGLYDCSINSDIFHHWVEHILLSELPVASIIVMDNATFHKRKDTQELIEKAGYHILWLPTYSPDLNPIEKMWAWLKCKRREWRIKCIDTLFFYFMWICNNY